jgi:protein TonB
MTLKPFEALIDDVHSEGLQRHSGEHNLAPTRRQGPQPILALGTYSLTDADPLTRTPRGVALPASMFLHGAAAVALAIVPLLVVETLPSETGGVRAFFVEPISAPPAPPPPPPAPARSAAARSVAPKAAVQPAGFTAPIEVPTEIKPEDGIDMGVEGGVPGGVEGGVPGGVVGGVVGGLPDAPPPPPLKPVHVGGDIREPRKVVDAAAVYPPLALKAQLEGVVIIEATIDARGRVQNAMVLRSVPLLDEAALAAVRQWVYTPTLLNGVPTPIIMTVTVTFRLKRT